MEKKKKKNDDGLMVKSYDVDNSEVEFTTNIKEAYNYGALGEWDAKTEIEFLVHHLKNEHKELETMKYTIVPC